MKKKIENVKWYDSGDMITNLILLTILLIIVVSQSFAINGESSLALFSSVINHNTVYLLVFVYFLCLKFKFGKKYFDYMNLILVFIYFISTFTSFLTIIQSFSLSTVLNFIVNFVLVVYLIHTMFRDTSYWNEYKIGNSPFNELSNDWYFYSVLVLGVFSLCVSLISTVEVSGVVLSLLDFIYVCLFGRYIYLYREYLDKKKINFNNKGTFDDIKNEIKTNFEEFSEKINNEVEDIKSDKTIKEVTEKIQEASSDVKDKINDFVEENEIDKKIVDLGDKVVDKTVKTIDKVNETINDNDKKVKKNNKKKKKRSTSNNISIKKGDEK